MKVLIGYDGTPGSEQALDDLARAGLPQQGEAVVLTVTEQWPPGPVVMPSALVGAPIGIGGAFQDQVDDFVKQMKKQALSHARAGADRFKKMFPGWQVTSEIDISSPNSALLARAESLKADLLVVGSQGHSALGRLLFGSIAQNVLHHARCPVRIGRGRSEGARPDPQEPARIVLGVDGSAGSELAAKAIGQRNWPRDSVVRVIAATYVTPLELAASDGAIPTVSVATAWQESRRLLEQAAQRQAEYLRQHGLSATPVLHMESPRYILLKEAEQWDADCIFVGARGLGGLERLLLGSVSSFVAARAHCSVEVVR